MNEQLTEKLTYLRMGCLQQHWDDYLQTAAKKNYSHDRLLKHVVDEEYRVKKENARKIRMRNARIPDPLRIETFPFAKQPKLSRKKIMALYDGDRYWRRGENIIWLGPTGCGKTGLACAFLIQAVEQGRSARHVLFAELLTELYQAAADHSEAKVLKRYLAYDVLLIDEIGYVDVESLQVGHFFVLMQKRHKKKSTLMTSNLGFAEWGTFLKNDHLTAALIDRLTENSHVFNMRNCLSLRAKLKTP